ncbi:MAG: homoserine dehydrogenase [Lachnospiraceae bacterium]|nr:homoserine dehydrogenase [Lachnospiraceae bacterium]
MIQVAVMGYGTVGSGVVEVINTNAAGIEREQKDDMKVKYVLDLREFPGDPVQSILVHDFDVIVNDSEVDVIAETMGGLHPAYEYTKRALEAGKSVCTSNKELVAAYGAELLELAKNNDVNYFYEASVGGGIPIIRPLNYALTAEIIEEITGILNGTTNYILTRMKNEGLEFDEVLKAAQELGYAEKNPEADVEGYDACRKIAILCSLAFCHQVDYKDIYTEGITKITATDIKYANACGRSIKLLASGKRDGEDVYAMVAPFMIDAQNPLYMVNDVYNGILVKSNMLGDTMYYGRGAGKLPTASAVVADMIDAARHKGATEKFLWDKKKLEVADMSHCRNRFFVRMEGTREEVLAKGAAYFGKVEPLASVAAGEAAFITGEMEEAEFEEAAKKAGGVINRIRVK